jgi:6-phosphogluconolactonase (cycloisomerase 2 family)
MAPLALGDLIMQSHRLFTLSIAIALGLSGSAYAQSSSLLPRLDSPYIYVMSNDIHANSVAVLKRSVFGGLDKVAVVPTGGVGVGVGTTAPPPDPLGSQNALLKSDDGRWLFATNAGSNQISVFAIRGGQLNLTDVVASGGTYPVSVAQRGNRVYVLNSAGASNVAVFELNANGHLAALANETRVIGTDQALVGNQPNVGMTPAELQLTPDGQWLAVAVKDASAKGWFELFSVDRHGDLAQDPTITPSNDPQPFGFAFDRRGHLITSEAAESAASSYAVTRDGHLQAISSDVANGQAAACWLAVSGRYAFTANAGKGNISAYRISENGALTLIGNGVAATLESGAAPTDLKVSPDGLFLYVGNSLGGDVDSYLILPDGQLFKVGQTVVFPGASGMQGLAI